MARIHIDDELKKAADEMFTKLGMSTSVAVKMFLTRFVKTGKLPSEIETAGHSPNEETLKAFKETEKMIEQGNLTNTEEVQAYFDRMKKAVDLDG